MNEWLNFLPGAGGGPLNGVVVWSLVHCTICYIYVAATAYHFSITIIIIITLFAKSTITKYVIEIQMAGHQKTWSSSSWRSSYICYIHKSSIACQLTYCADAPTNSNKTSSSAMAERPRELGDFKKARVNGGTNNHSLVDSHKCLRCRWQTRIIW